MGIEYNRILRNVYDPLHPNLAASRDSQSIAGYVDRTCNYMGNMNFNHESLCVPVCRKGDIDCISSGFGRCRLATPETYTKDKDCNSIKLTELFNEDQLKDTIISQRLIHEACTRSYEVTEDGRINQCIGDFLELEDAYYVPYLEDQLADVGDKVVCTTKDLLYDGRKQYIVNNAANTVVNKHIHVKGTYKDFDKICGEVANWTKFPNIIYHAPICYETDRTNCEFNDYLVCSDLTLVAPKEGTGKDCSTVTLEEAIKNVTNDVIAEDLFITSTFLKNVCQNYPNGASGNCSGTSLGGDYIIYGDDTKGEKLCN